MHRTPQALLSIPLRGVPHWAPFVTVCFIRFRTAVVESHSVEVKRVGLIVETLYLHLFTEMQTIHQKQVVAK